MLDVIRPSSLVLAVPMPALLWVLRQDPHLSEPRLPWYSRIPLQDYPTALSLPYFLSPFAGAVTGASGAGPPLLSKKTGAPESC